MTTCKQPKRQEDLTPQLLTKAPASLREKGEQDWSLDQRKVIPVPSPLRGGLGRGSSSLLTPSRARRALGRGYLYLLQKSISAKSSNSSGFTIIECLVAIIMVSILMTAVAPVIVLSVATRVQARRVEQATMAGRNYIDAVQSGTISMPQNVVPLYEAEATTVGATTKEYLGSDRANFAEVAAPPSTPISCSSDITANPYYPYCTDNDPTTSDPNAPSLYCVDNDGGGCTSGSNRDFIVQGFRSVRATAPGVPDPNDDGSGGYVLGVRVYRADAFDGAATLQTTRLNSGKKVATYTGGKGNQFAPLAEFTTEIPSQAEAGSGDAMKNLCDRLGGCTN